MNMDISLNTPFQFQPSAQLLCAGQPDEAGFRAAAQAGVKAVLNLRPDAEMVWDEAALLGELGVEYLQIPISSAEDLSQDNARILNQWLAQRQDETVLIHCASSNRVGALLALGAALEGSTNEEALALGRSAGLTKMEPLVQALLQQWSG
ncbi:MAG: hypothetical protein ACSHXK_15465 [Oceanococcus sp.]